MSTFATRVYIHPRIGKTNFYEASQILMWIVLTVGCRLRALKMKIVVVTGPRASPSEERPHWTLRCYPNEDNRLTLTVHWIPLTGGFVHIDTFLPEPGHQQHSFDSAEYHYFFVSV
ncbi:hypothetical protein VKT23_020764 [Stygiomarasmius scandens]|uniref:Uncharacterized protein n=1 Tax=Marasmiellus scandens TaxID=2682957 RepID=A0ABR1IKR9_9AGAR